MNWFNSNDESNVGVNWRVDGIWKRGNEEDEKQKKNWWWNQKKNNNNKKNKERERNGLKMERR